MAAATVPNASLQHAFVTPDGELYAHAHTDSASCECRQRSNVIPFRQVRRLAELAAR
jgi:hypothetical protein